MSCIIGIRVCGMAGGVRWGLWGFDRRVDGFGSEEKNDGGRGVGA